MPPEYRVLDANTELVAEPSGTSKQVVVSCEEHVRHALFGAGQMQRVESAEPKFPKVLSALCRTRRRNNDFIRERE